MFKNSSKILFLLILILGTLLTISSNSWLGAWMGLEINLLSFIPLMNETNNLMSTEASLKYFLVQALASTVLLFAVIMSMMNINFTFQMNNNYSHMIILSTLLLKSGAAPFHFWFPEVMKHLSWMNALILMTWQKIAPMMLISYLLFKSMFFISVLLSIIIGSLGGLNQTSLQKIMAYSSINHLGWMLGSMLTSESLWLLYFAMYTFLSFNMVYFFDMFKLYHLNQLFNLFFSSKTLKFSLFLNLLSLGGLPPFLGFLPKWIVIQDLTFNNQLFLMTAMVTMTLITLFYYIRLCYAAFMLNYYENNWLYAINYNNSFFLVYLILSFISSFGLFFVNLTYFTF